MSAALDLIQTVKANGGRMRVEGDSLVIAPETAALSVLDELRQHKREIIRLLEIRTGQPAHDPEEWREPFVRWIRSTCAFRPRAFGGVAALHLAFCEWEIQRDGVPCNLETFLRMLAELGLFTGEIEGTLLVSGLTFRDDVEAVGLGHG